MPWVYLMVASVIDVIWFVALKYAEGFTKPLPSIICVLTIPVGFYALSMAIKHIPLATAYAVWVGVSTIGLTILGILLFGESRSVTKLLAILIIVVCIAILKGESEASPAATHMEEK